MCRVNSQNASAFIEAIMRKKINTRNLYNMNDDNGSIAISCHLTSLPMPSYSPLNFKSSRGLTLAHSTLSIEVFYSFFVDYTVKKSRFFIPVSSFPTSL